MAGDVVKRSFDLAGALLHGDCYRLLPNLPSEAVDLVLTDPPYGQAHEALLFRL